MNRGFSFPSIMKINIENLQIDIYKDIYIKYIESYSSERLKNIIKMWQDGLDLTGDDYKYIIDGSFIPVRNHPNIMQPSTDLLEQMGIELDRNESGEFTFGIVEKKVESIGHEVYDSVFINIMKEEIGMLVEDVFGDVNRTVGLYRVAVDNKEFAIDKACRVAMKFTLLDYMLNQDSSIDFIEFFIDEFSKRIKLVKFFSDRAQNESDVKYYPIYDHFSNYDTSLLSNLKDKLDLIIQDSVVSSTDKDEILNGLSIQLYSIDDLTDANSIRLINELYQPLLTTTLEVNKCEQILNTAQDLFELATDDNSVVDRCFYSAMHACRALLSKCGILADWSIGTLSPSEKHHTLESKLQNVMQTQAYVYSDFYNDFRYIKAKRWISDYSLYVTERDIAEECLDKARQMCQSVKFM